MFRIANYLVRKARFSSFVNAFFILKTHQDCIHCCDYNESVKSQDSLAT